MAADGSGLLRLTNNPADDQLPFWRSRHQTSSSALPIVMGARAPLTARQLTAPGALMGTGPASFSWSPAGARLVYVEPQDERDVLWIYDPEADEKKVLLDPGENPDRIDLSSAQWSPQGDQLLLAGGTSLWLLDAQTGGLKPA